MPKYSRPRAALLILSIIVGLAVGSRLLREQPSEGAVVLTAEVLWVPVPANFTYGSNFVKDGKTLAVRVRNASATPAKLFDLSWRRIDRATLHISPDGLIVEPELQGHSGGPILAGLHASVRSRRNSVSPDIMVEARPVYEHRPWQSGVPDRFERHFAGKQPVFEFVPGQSIDVPLDPLPMYIRPTDLDPGVLTVVALVKWPDAATSERQQFRSQPLSFDLTAEDLARCKDEYEATQVKKYGAKSK